MNPAIILDVVRFELLRSKTIGRMMVWVALVAFPVTLIAILKVNVPVDSGERMGIVLFLLVPEVLCLLGLLLWATPSIATEVEGQTWIYLAMRQSGRGIVAIGKYLTAVIWTLTAALTATTICTLIIQPENLFRFWSVMCVISTLSCFAHASLYLLLGVLFRRRTMVSAVGFTLVCEFGLSFIPALANKFTVNYRLRGLLAEWMQWDDVRNLAEEVFGSEPVSTHLLSLAIYTALLLFIALVRLQFGEFPTQQDG